MKYRTNVSLNHSRHSRGKSDTDFHYVKNLLDSAESSLNYLRETMPFKSNSKNQNYVHKSPFFLKKKNTIELTTYAFQPPKDINDALLMLLEKILLFKKQLDGVYFDNRIKSIKFELDNLLQIINKNLNNLIDELISLNPKIKINPLVKKLTRLGDVIVSIIETKPQEFYREIKVVIIEQFEKNRIDIIEYLDKLDTQNNKEITSPKINKNNKKQEIKLNSINKEENKIELTKGFLFNKLSDVSLFNKKYGTNNNINNSNEVKNNNNEIDDCTKIIMEKKKEIKNLITDITQTVLFSLSTICYDLDYHSTITGILIYALFNGIIFYMENSPNGQYNNNKSKEFKTLHLIEHILNLSRTYTKRVEVGKYNIDSSIFYSLSKFILNNLNELVPKCKLLSIKENNKNNKISLFKNDYYLYYKKYLSIFYDKKKELSKLFKLFYNSKLVYWKKIYIKLEDNKQKTICCRICEQKISLNEFILHVNYCKEQKLFYERNKERKIFFDKNVDSLNLYIDEIKKNPSKEKNDLFSKNGILNSLLKRVQDYKISNKFFNPISSRENILKKSEEHLDFLTSLIKIYTKEKEKSIFYYERKPEDLPCILSLLYLSFFIYVTNKQSKNEDEIINDTFSNFISVLVDIMLNIQILLIVKESKTKINADESKRFSNYLNEAKPIIMKNTKEITYKDIYNKDKDKEKEKIIDNQKQNIKNNFIASKHEEKNSKTPITRKSDKLNTIIESSSSNCTFQSFVNEFKSKLSLNRSLGTTKKHSYSLLFSHIKEIEKEKDNKSNKNIQISEKNMSEYIQAHSSNVKGKLILFTKAQNNDNINDNNKVLSNNNKNNNDLLDNSNKINKSISNLYSSSSNNSSNSESNSSNTGLIDLINIQKKQRSNRKNKTVKIIKNERIKNAPIVDKKFFNDDNINLPNRGSMQKKYREFSFDKRYKDDDNDLSDYNIDKEMSPLENEMDNKKNQSRFWKNKNNNNINENNKGISNISKKRRISKKNSVKSEGRVTNSGVKSLFHNKKMDISNNNNSKEVEKKINNSEIEFEKDSLKNNSNQENSFIANNNDDSISISIIQHEEEEDEDEDIINDNDKEDENVNNNKEFGNVKHRKMNRIVDKDGDNDNEDNNINKKKPFDSKNVVFIGEEIEKNSALDFGVNLYGLNEEVEKLAYDYKIANILEELEDNINSNSEKEKSLDKSPFISNTQNQEEDNISSLKKINNNNKNEEEPFKFIQQRKKTFDLAESSQTKELDNLNTSKISYDSYSPDVCLIINNKPKISHFELIFDIAKGGFGSVSLYKKKSTGDIYAIKIVNIHNMKERKLSNSLKIERKILTEVNCEYVVSPYFIFKDKQNYYFVMEYLPGGDIYSLISSIILPFQEIRLIIAETLLAVHYLHHIKIIHHDIKPENILISKEGHFKLSDFGLSKTIDPENNNNIPEKTTTNNINNNIINNSNSLSNENEESNAVGTLNYMAPELFTDEYPITSAVDYWAIGIVIFELFSFNTPFEAETPQKIRENIIANKINWEPMHSPDVQKNYQNIDIIIDFITKFIQKNPNDRWGDKNFTEIKHHPFFNDFNWNNIESVKRSLHIFSYLKGKIDDTNKKMKEAYEKKKGKDKENKEDLKTISFDQNLVNDEDDDNFQYTERIDNLNKRNKELIKMKFKKKQFKIEEDKQKNLLNDLK